MSFSLQKSSLVVAALSAVIASAGCPGCQPVEPDGGPGPDPIIAFSTPRDGFVLNNADDKDGDPANGIQVDVRVRYSGAEGTTLTLSSDQSETATSDTEGGFATFVSFTIAASGEGVVNVLTATDGDVSESISVTGRTNELPPAQCGFVSPTDGATLALASDANTAQPGFQFSARVACTGTGVRPGLSLALSAGGDVVTRTLDANLEVNALVTAANAPGANVVTAILRDGDTVLDETSINVNVSPDVNVCEITAPAENALLAVDADPLQGGFQIDVAVSCSGPNVFAGQTLTISAGAAPVTAPLVGAAAPYTAGGRVTAFGAGANTITATLQGDIASDAIVVEVVAATPFCEFVAPVSGSVVTSDLDADTAGIQLEATVHCGDVAAETAITVSGGTDDVTGALDQDGDVTLVVTVADEGEHTLTASVGPPVADATTTFTVSLVSVCDADIVSPDDGAVFDAAAIDADPSTTAFDVAVGVATSPTCAGATARVTVGAEVFEALVDETGTATVIVALGDGVHVLTAVVENEDGIGASDAIEVTVDRTPAIIVVSSPSDGAVYGPADDLDGDPANGISVALGGGVTGAASASYVLSCGGSEIASGALTLDVDGTFDTVLADLAVGTCTLTVSADDGVNPASVDVDFTVANVSVDVTLGEGLDQAPLGAFIASEDKDPGTASTMEIDLDVTATFDTGTYTATYEVVRTSDSVVVLSGSLGALASGVATSVELELPYGEETDYRVDVTLTPDAGPVVVASETFVVDTVAPTLAWQSPAAGFVLNAATDQSASPGFQGFFAIAATGHSGRTVELAFTGASSTTATCTVGLADLCATTVTLVDGAYSVTATASDPAGNVAVPAVRSFGVDATLPLVESVRVVNDTVDAAGNTGPDGQLNRAENGGLSAPATSSVVVTFAAGAAIESGRNVTLKVTPGASYVAASNGSSVTFANVVLAEGALTFTVTGTDQAANPTSLSGQPFPFRVDTTAPSVTLVAPTGGAITTSPVTISVSTNAEPGQVVTLTDVTGGGALPLGTAVVVGGGANITGVVLEQGSRTLRASVRDLAGNPAEGERTWLVDTEAPSLTLSAISDPAVDANPALAGWQVEFAVVHTGLEAGRTIRLVSNLTGERGSAPASGTGTTSIVGTFTTSALHTMTATATDLAGGVGVSNAVQVDIVTGELDVFVDSPNLVDGALLFSGLDVTAGSARVVVTVPGASLATVVTLRVDGVDTAATVDRSGDTFVVSFSVNEGDVGTVEVALVDGAETGTTGVLAFVIDAVAPAVAWGAGTPMLFNTSTDGAPSVAGLQTTVSVDVDECEGGVVEILEGAAIVGGPSAVGASGTGSISVEIDDPVEHAGVAWTARCIDAAGNTGTAELVTTVDLTAPAAPLVTATVLDAKRGLVALTVTAPGDDGATGAAVLLEAVAAKAPPSLATFAAAALTPVFPGRGGLLGSSSTTPAGDDVVFDAAALAYDNTWHFAVRATDAAGNQSLGTASAELALASISLEPSEDGIGCDDDRFPSTTTLAGDFDGDGQDDLVLASPGTGDQAGLGCYAGYADGKIDLWAGRDDVSTIAVDAPTKSLTLLGQSFALGYRMALADLDGDGRSDLVAYSEDQNFPYAQHLVIAYGTDAETGGVKDLVDAPRFVFVGGGAPSYGLYFDTIRTIGDVNGDGFDDVWLGPIQFLAGEQLRGRILFGSSTRVAPSDDFDDLPHAIVTSTIAGVTALGVAAPLGNLDGDTNGTDGLDDFIVDQVGGALVVVRGRATWPTPPATFDLASVVASDRLTCGGSQCGKEITSGDVNGDGRTDIVTIQPTTNNVLVFLENGAGAYPTTRSYVMQAPGGLLSGFAAQIAVGDTNDDGYDDVLFASYTGGGTVAPAVRVYFGGAYVEGNGLTSGARTVPDTSYELAYNAEEYAALAACGDLDGDGTDEVCYGTEVGEGVFHVRY